MNVSVSLDTLLVWFLASIRVLALFSSAPLFGHLSLPARARVAFALVISWTLAPEPALEIADQSAIQIFAWVASEAVIGFSIGILAQVIFAAFGMLGQFISIQGGLGAARVIDPSSGASSDAMGALLQWTALVVYLSVGGHHLLLSGLTESFELLPIGGGPPPSSGLMEMVVTAGQVVYSTAVKLSLPVTVAMLVGNAALGILGRSIQQLNLMTVQLPAHIAGMLFIVAYSARSLVVEMSKILTVWTGNLSAAVAGIP